MPKNTRQWPRPELESEQLKVEASALIIIIIIIIIIIMQLYLQDETFTQHTELLRILYLRLHFCYYTTYTTVKVHELVKIQMSQSPIKLGLVAYIALFYK